MPLSDGMRGRVPERLRRNKSLRQLALRTGLVPPRDAHSQAETELLQRLASGRRRAVLIGVHEGSCALGLVDGLPQGADLHLVEEFLPAVGTREHSGEHAVKALVGRAAKRRGGPALTWHVASSEEAARGWPTPVDMVVIDGDHSREACRADWDLWSPHVRIGGVVAFHGARGGVEGPTLVVGELFGAGDPRGWRVLAERETIVAVEHVPVTLH